jgi:hypothetical protein
VKFTSTAQAAVRDDVYLRQVRYSEVGRAEEVRGYSQTYGNCKMTALD